MHHRSDHDCVLAREAPNDGPLDHLAHAQDRDLRLVDDRETVEVPLTARVRHGDRPSAQLIGRELLAPGALRQVFDRSRGLRDCLWRGAEQLFPTRHARVDGP